MNCNISWFPKWQSLCPLQVLSRHQDPCLVYWSAFDKYYMSQHITWLLQPFLLKTSGVAPVYKMSHLSAFKTSPFGKLPCNPTLHPQPPPPRSQGFHIWPGLLSPLSETRQRPQTAPISHHPSVNQTPGPPWVCLLNPSLCHHPQGPAWTWALVPLLTITVTSCLALCLLFFLPFPSFSLPLYQYPVIFLKSKSNYPMPSHNFQDKNPKSTGCGPFGLAPAFLDSKQVKQFSMYFLCPNHPFRISF